MAAQRLVVRTYAPLRRLLLIGGMLAFAGLGLYAAFEWGRSTAGFDGLGALSEKMQLRSRITEQDREIHTQRLAIATFETERVGQTRERTELAKTIGDLQADVARLTSDLAFYRGIAGDKTSDQVIKVQQFRVTRGKAPDEYLVRLDLGRPLRADDVIAGRVRLTFEGTSGGAALNLDLAAVAGIASGDLPFSYRYVQTLEQVVRLPAGFMPARTTVEIIPGRKGVNPVRESFIWSVEN